MIQLEDVHVSFGALDVLRGIDLQVDQGESVVLFGPSGCGKSTILRVCQGLATPVRGDVWIGGQNLRRLSRKQMDGMRAKTGSLFQYNALFDSMSIEENVAFFLREHGVLPEREIKTRVNHYLKLVNLEGVNDLRPSELSGGMQKRVGIVRAIIHHPEIVYYDSPTDGLDPLTADLITDLILELNDRHHVTCLAVSNDMATAFKLGERLAMVYNGQIMASGPRDELRTSDDPFVVQFINGDDEGPITDCQTSRAQSKRRR